MEIKRREHWSGRLGFVLAALGSAIGLGTLWKFPYVTGDNGGGMFVLCYLIFTLILGIPLFIGELILGRRAGRGAVGIFVTLAGEKSAWRAIGWLGVLASFLILSYYCVVAGWGLNYLLLSLTQFYTHHTEAQISGIFDVLYKSGDISLFWAFIFLALTFGVVYQGIRKGVEFWSRILTISLTILVVVLFFYATSLDGFKEAVHFLFVPHLSDLKPSGVLEALGLSLFTLSLAQGVILTYGSYLLPSENLHKVAFIVGFSVILISLLTVLIIFPVIFTFGLPPHGGAGLVFKTLPVLFAKLPGSMIISIIFFTLFVFTALTSAMALLEVVVANLMDLYSMPRKRATLYATIAAFIVGIPSALAGSQELFKSWVPIYGTTFFDTIDSLVSVWLLPLGAFLTALYLGWYLDKNISRDELMKGGSSASVFVIWFFLIRYVVPIGVLLIFLQNGGVINIDKLF